MKQMLIWILCMGMIGFFAVSGFSEEGELCFPLGTITLTPPEGVEAERAPVEFPHSVHFDYSCKACHHEWTGGEEDLGCMASGCHDSGTSLLMTNPDEAYRYFKTAYHAQCIGCHKEIKEENLRKEMSLKDIEEPLPKTGPTGCNECHPGQ